MVETKIIAEQKVLFPNLRQLSKVLSGHGVVWIVHLLIGEVSQLGDPLADVIARGIKLLGLRERVQNAEVRLTLNTSRGALSTKMKQQQQ